MINFLLAALAALLWGGAYGAYFAPELRRWRHRSRRRPMLPSARVRRASPARTRSPQAAIPAYAGLAARNASVASASAASGPPRSPPPPSNVIPFPRKPRG